MKLFESVDPDVSEAGDDGGGTPEGPAASGNGTPLLCTVDVLALARPCNSKAEVEENE